MGRNAILISFDGMGWDGVLWDGVGWCGMGLGGMKLNGDGWMRQVEKEARGTIDRVRR